MDLLTPLLDNLKFFAQAKILEEQDKKDFV
jgi:hypothetical protein